MGKEVLSKLAGTHCLDPAVIRAFWAAMIVACGRIKLQTGAQEMYAA